MNKLILSKKIISLLGIFIFTLIFPLEIKSSVIPSIDEKDSQNNEYLEKDSYILGGGDILRIIIFDSKEFSGNYKILNDGSINLPLIGIINVSNMSIE